MEPIRLTATQIAHVDEISAEKLALNNMLKITTNYFVNRQMELEKDLKIWWRELDSVHGLDLENKKYKIDKYCGAVVVVEVKDEDKKLND